MSLTWGERCPSLAQCGIALHCAISRALDWPGPDYVIWNGFDGFAASQCGGCPSAAIVDVGISIPGLHELVIPYPRESEITRVHSVWFKVLCIDGTTVINPSRGEIPPETTSPELDNNISEPNSWYYTSAGVACPRRLGCFGRRWRFWGHRERLTRSLPPRVRRCQLRRPMAESWFR